MTAPAIARSRHAISGSQRARKQRVVVRRHVDLSRDQVRGVRVGLRWPIGLDEAIRAELTGHLPLPVAKLLERAETRGYMAGRLATLQQVAQNVAELDLLGEGWRETAVAALAHAREQQRQAREEAASARLAARAEADGSDRHAGYRYRGGAVDYDTGLPAGSACAWLRRQRAQAAAVTHLRPVAVSTPALREEAA